ncbi:uncharacterized protein LOC119481846 isoform X7 [Sebastes umbrosus]|uniref:uncharacterized protein LOC119481846 isoform X7 n=1 Tax=Sebastes umbrosus TaxID=72105 RepID=UPI00189C8CE0|nr:uncharacterized protein LOC119481846 isoform X7 [Sebastes umbrosus]
MKMICSILLLLSLTSCVSGAFVVNVTQTSYQAEENHNITLEWMFTTRTNSSSKSLFIICLLSAEPRPLVLFHLREGVEDPESQDEQFTGRVRWDKDVLRDGRIRLHMSRLRINDSGWYQCDVQTGDGRGSEICHLKVTAAADEPKPPRPIMRPQPERPRMRPEPERPIMRPQPERPRMRPEPERPIMRPQPERPTMRPQPESPTMRPPERPTMRPQPERPTMRPEPESPGTIGFYVIVGLAALLVLCAGLYFLHKCTRRPIRGNTETDVQPNLNDPGEDIPL